MKYALKDKERQAKLDALSDVNKFSERLQEACKNQMSNSYNTVTVCFGDLLVLDDRIYCESHVFQNRLVILKNDIEVIEDLKPYVWHSREKWDGNPNNYSVIEFDNDEPDLFIGIRTNRLVNNTTHFMYIEQPEVSNEQD